MICKYCNEWQPDEDEVIELRDHRDIAAAALSMLNVHGGMPGILLVDELAAHGWTLAKTASIPKPAWYISTRGTANPTPYLDTVYEHARRHLK
jgi:hypothetical protein